MLRRLNELAGARIEATDGEIGAVSDFLLDDEQWTVRYLVADPRGWLSTERVLISPISVLPPVGGEGRIRVRLTRDQVRNSPLLTSDEVPRRYEAELAAHYGYPSYWIGGGLWGAAAVPATLAPAPLPPATPADAEIVQREAESRLKSARAITGFHIRALDGEIGHADDFLAHEESWQIRFLVIDTSNWIGGKSVLVSPAWARVAWLDGEIQVDATRDQIKASPAFDPSRPITREYEEQLAGHFRGLGMRR